MQKEKAHQLNALHHSGKLLILPNVWDVLGAVLLENLEFPAVATASASIAWASGYNDGQQVPFNQALIRLTEIAASVNVPVTADIESAYATTDEQLRENVERLLETGIVGINIEDTNTETNEMYSVVAQSGRINIIRETADAKGIPLFINARTDVVFHSALFASEEARLDEIIKRGQAYKEAGADCFYPIAIKKKEQIQKLVDELDYPINLLTIPGIPPLKELEEMGVARVSLGPSFLKLALKTMKDTALKLKEYEGLTEIITNDVTSDFVKGLVSKR